MTPVQVDGEPWEQHPAQLNITFHNQATVLKCMAEREGEGTVATLSTFHSDQAWWSEISPIGDPFILCVDIVYFCWVLCYRSWNIVNFAAYMMWLWILYCWMAIFVFVSINVFIAFYMLPVIELFWSLN